MVRAAAALAMAFLVGWPAQAFEEPKGLLDHFLARIRTELKRLPDYVCTQTVERFSRSTAEQPWAKVDTLRFDVALVGKQELYSLPGARRFENRSLAEMVGRGTISTGQMGLLAEHVFLTPSAHFTYRGQSEGESDRAGRTAHQYDYDVPPEHSSYRLRSGTAESTVGFQGAFWIDAETLDLIRLEVQAYDIPAPLGLAEANTLLSYARVTIDSGDTLLPVSATFSVAAVDGIETLNRSGLSACRHYRADSAIQFAGEPAPAQAEQPIAGNHKAENAEDALPTGALIELSLDSSLDPTTAGLGDAVTARVIRPIKDGEQVLVAQGATVTGSLVRLEKQTAPFLIYEIGLEFHSLDMGDRKLRFSATLEDAGPAAGLLRQSKRIDPTFTRKRTARMEILVREVQHGQGFLHWDARRGPVPRGLRMKWRVEPVNAERR